MAGAGGEGEELHLPTSLNKVTKDFINNNT